MKAYEIKYIGNAHINRSTEALILDFSWSPKAAKVIINLLLERCVDFSVKEVGFNHGLSSELTGGETLSIENVVDMFPVQAEEILGS